MLAGESEAVSESGGGEGIDCGLLEVKAVAKEEGEENGFVLGRAMEIGNAEGGLEFMLQVLAQLGKGVGVAGDLGVTGVFVGPDAPVDLLAEEGCSEGIGFGIVKTAYRADGAGNAEILAWEGEGSGIVPCQLAETWESFAGVLKVDILEDEAQAVVRQSLGILDLAAKALVFFGKPGRGRGDDLLRCVKLPMRPEAWEGEE